MLSLKFLESYFKKIDKIEIGQLQQTFSQLKEDYRIFYRFLENIQSSIFLLDSHYIPLFINSHAIKTFHLSSQDLPLDITNILPIEEFALNFKKWIKSQESILKIEMMSGQNIKKIWSVECINLVSKERLSTKEKLCYIVVIRDITTEKKVQEQILLKKNLESMQHLAASLAHEIKNPLTSIHLYLSLVEKYSEELPKKDTQEILSSIHIIKQEVDRLNTITTDFLTNIRPLSLNISKIHAEELISSLRELIQPILTKEQIYLSISIEEHLPFIAGDITYIRMVLLNILKNSIESFEGISEDKIKIDHKKSIAIKLEENSPFIQITIKDNGRGIAKEHLEKIFEPYFTTKTTGSGIGLSLSHKVVLEHKGDIYIESQPYKGTTTRILLPIYKGMIHKFLSP